jgi:alkylhydroperoxidase family enzyme
MPRIAPLRPGDYTEAHQKAFEHHTSSYRARITNMKATLAHSLTAFEVYMQWYPLYEEVKKITGERLASLYAYAISYAADCPLCTTYFRKVIIDRGEDPAQFQVDAYGQHLLSFGSAIADRKGQVPEDLFRAIKKQYSDAELVVLIAFAGQMIATNIFNNVVQTDIDDYLTDYLPREREMSNE